jgi:hypothetical protein
LGIGAGTVNEARLALAKEGASDQVHARESLSARACTVDMALGTIEGG